MDEPARDTGSRDVGRPTFPETVGAGVSAAPTSENRIQVIGSVILIDRVGKLSMVQRITSSLTTGPTFSGVPE